MKAKNKNINDFLESKINNRCHHISYFKLSAYTTKQKGDIAYFIIGCHCGAFGEPNGALDMWINGPEETAVNFHGIDPNTAILIGEEIIARAKQARAMWKRWKRKKIEGYIPLKTDDLDKEDRGAYIHPEGKTW